MEQPKPNPPRYVRMERPDDKGNGVTLRLVIGGEYWRDGGQWGIRYQRINNQWVTIRDSMVPKSARLKLTRISQEEYIKTNYGYITKEYLDNYYDGKPLPKHDIPFEEQKLYDADPNCKHNIVAQWSGIRCSNCGGWFCH